MHVASGGVEGGGGGACLSRLPLDPPLSSVVHGSPESLDSCLVSVSLRWCTQGKL